jgi:hypothetical protein
MIKMRLWRSFENENIEATWDSKEVENMILALLDEKKQSRIKFNFDCSTCYSR